MGEKVHTGVKDIPGVSMQVICGGLTGSSLETMNIYITGTKILKDKVNP